MLGIDLVKIDRIDKLFKKFGDKFLNRIFKEEEITYIRNRGNKVETIAGMFASKEAVSKALGTGIGKVGFRDIIIEHSPGPKAKVGNKRFELAISHDGEYAVAVCMLKSEEDEHEYHKKG